MGSKNYIFINFENFTKRLKFSKGCFGTF